LLIISSPFVIGLISFFNLSSDVEKDVISPVAAILPVILVFPEILVLPVTFIELPIILICGLLYKPPPIVNILLLSPIFKLEEF
jgi:hypothetical protein